MSAIFPSTRDATARSFFKERVYSETFRWCGIDLLLIYSPAWLEPFVGPISDHFRCLAPDHEVMAACKHTRHKLGSRNVCVSVCVGVRTRQGISVFIPTPLCLHMCVCLCRYCVCVCAECVNVFLCVLMKTFSLFIVHICTDVDCTPCVQWWYIRSSSLQFWGPSFNLRISVLCFFTLARHYISAHITALVTLQIKILQRKWDQFIKCMWKHSAATWFYSSASVSCQWLGGQRQKPTLLTHLLTRPQELSCPHTELTIRSPGSDFSTS